MLHENSSLGRLNEGLGFLLDVAVRLLLHNDDFLIGETLHEYNGAESQVLDSVEEDEIMLEGRVFERKLFFKGQFHYK